jgi:hypothetical protein
MTRSTASGASSRSMPGRLPPPNTSGPTLSTRSGSNRRLYRTSCSSPTRSKIPLLCPSGAGGRILVGDAAHRRAQPRAGRHARDRERRGAAPHPYVQPRRGVAGLRAGAPRRRRRIIALAARTNTNKAGGPLGRLRRDLALSVAMKFVKPERMAWWFDYHIDCDTSITGGRQLGPAEAAG